MKPYYQDDAVMLYCGDVRNVLAELPEFDLLITDPPYQSLDVEVRTGTTTRLVRRDEFGGKRLAASDGPAWFATMSIPNIQSILQACKTKLRSTGASYVFADVKTGLELFAHYRPRNVIVWDKQTIGMGYAWRRMHEWIGYFPQGDHVLRDQRLGDIIRCPTLPDKWHPTEKPMRVMHPLITNSSDVGQTVVDPFAGIGTTLRAAKDLGRKAIGIEIEERYCEIAAKRCAQEVLQFAARR